MSKSLIVLGGILSKNSLTELDLDNLVKGPTTVMYWDFVSFVG
jgi:hypothetical protein